jgi:thiosulfate dehydrogenase
MRLWTALRFAIWGLAFAASAPAVCAAPVAEKSIYESRGGLGYLQFCATCHRLDGRGAENIFPALAGNQALQAESPVWAIDMVLGGGKADGKPHVFRMPAFATLGDAEVAEIVSFTRAAWGGKGGPVTAAQVAAERADYPPTELVGPEPPRFAELLRAANSALLIQGLQEVVETRALLPEHVNAALNCGSCHLNGGTVALAAPYWGIDSIFPTKTPRAGRVISLEERINECFERSMNGVALAAASSEMQAMKAFFAAMKATPSEDGAIEGRGTMRLAKSTLADPERGKLLFAQQCAACHGDDGDGARGAQGERLFPPLWGPDSFNIGAGMARTFTAAGFVKGNMPLAHSTRFPLAQGGLTEQDAVDVAAWFSHRPRPDFAAKDRDWPNGGKPGDARY